MVRIMLWSDRFWPAIGGVEMIAQLLALELHQLGYVLEVMTTRIPPLVAEEDFHGIPVHRLATPLSSLELDPVALAEERSHARALVKAFQPDLMLSLNPLHLLIHYQAAQHVHSARNLYWLQGYSKEMFVPTLITGQTLRDADYVVCCSRYSLDSARRGFPEITDHSRLIWNSVPTPTVEPAPLPWDPPKVIYVGRLSPEKGPDLLIRAFAQAAPKLPELRLVIAGDGSERQKLEAMVDTLGLRSRVDFVGWLHPNDVPAAINTATVLALPSRMEGFGIVGLQAAQMGRPVLGFRIDGIPEVCADGETGLLCAPEDVEDMAAKMIRLIEDRPATEAMGRAAKVRASTLFGWENFVQSTDALIRQLTEVAPEEITR
jgi:glycogen(starch) synthase